MRGLEMPLLESPRGDHEKDIRGMDQPQVLASREWGPQSYTHKELNLFSNLNELRSGFLSRAFGKDRSPAHTLTLAFETLRGGPSPAHLDFWPIQTMG